MTISWRLVWVVTCAAATVAPSPAAHNLTSDVSAPIVWVSAAVPDNAGAALAALTARALQTSGADARVSPPPVACRPPARADAPACLRAALAALATNTLQVMVVSMSAGSGGYTRALHDAGLRDLGDVAPPARRACVLPSTSDTPSDAQDDTKAARSMLDLTDETLARRHALTNSMLQEALQEVCLNITTVIRNECISYVKLEDQFSPEWCLDEASCGALLTTDASEARLLRDVIVARRLRLRVLQLGALLPAVTAALPPRAAPLVCAWSVRGTTLGPPPCSNYDTDCPFETRRLAKLVDFKGLARMPQVLRAISRLELNDEELRQLLSSAAAIGPELAAKNFIASRVQEEGQREVRVAALVPVSTSRQGYRGAALVAAAVLAEEELAQEGVPGAARLKVEVFDDECSAPRAYKYLVDALGTGEYGALSALAGPACGAAFADVARQSPALHLPLLSYSSVTEPGSGAAVLAGGGAGQRARALSSFLAALRWRRLAVLNEAATHAQADSARLHADLVAHVELPDDQLEVDETLVSEWLDRAQAGNARVLYVCAEDTRVAAAATRGNGSERVWLMHYEAAEKLLTGELKSNDYYFSIAPAWQVQWNVSENAAWSAKCLSRCLRISNAVSCGAACGARAALLYDTLRLWARALHHRLNAMPSALDDLHDDRFVESLIDEVSKMNFTGLTGKFEWTRNRDLLVRSTDYIVTQWSVGKPREVARWSPEAGLQLDYKALHWRGGVVPDDGADTCSLQALADALHADCRAAHAALGALVLVGPLAALAALALHLRRRAARAHAAQEALRLTSLQPTAAPSPLARWELPRERVVINRKLGVGAFGTVYGGHALLAEGAGWTAVAVKTLKAGASTEEKLDFLSEAETMKRFHHENVVRLLGVVTKTEPVCTVMEFVLYGDLRSYLLARRHLVGAEAGAEGGASGEVEEVSAVRLTLLARDAARALHYLAAQRYVHRDVAARNCLVSARRELKLADFGMARLVFEHDYYRFSRKGLLPVRWMAPESLTLGVFSAASDVWALGVLLYEMVTFGALPFQGMSNVEVLATVKAGGTLDIPLGVKPQLAELMSACWRRAARARPTAGDAAALLASCPRMLEPALGEPPPLHEPWQAQARWVSCAPPASQTTDTTYLSTDLAPLGAPPAPRPPDLLPPAPPPPPADLTPPELDLRETDALLP